METGNDKMALWLAWIKCHSSWLNLCQVSLNVTDLTDVSLQQEPITRSMQLPHIPVTAFSQMHLFLVSIYREFRPPQEPQWPITSRDLIFNWHRHFTGRLSGHVHLRPPFFPLLMRAYVDWNWPIVWEKKPKNRPVWELHVPGDGLNNAFNDYNGLPLYPYRHVHLYPTVSLIHSVIPSCHYFVC